MKKKTDRRVLRTRKQLSEAILALILERSYESITIQDITERADLNRATFYLHYGSKEELLVDSLETHFDALVQLLEAETNGEPPWGNPLHMQRVFEYVAENEALFRTVLSQQGLGYVTSNVIRYIAAYNERQMVLAQVGTAPLPASMISWHVAGSLFALISWWLENEMPHSPEFMARSLFQLCTVGTYSVMAEGEQMVVNGVEVHRTATVRRTG
jgi:AcrR family transcriptional regulator